MKLDQQVVREVGLFFIGAVIGFFLLVAGGYLAFHQRIFPGVHVGSLLVSGMSEDEAESYVGEKISEVAVEITYGDNSWEISGENLGISVERSVSKAYAVGRKWRGIDDVWQILSGKVVVEPEYDNNFSQLDELFEEVRSAVEIELIPTTLVYENEEVVFREGRDGIRLDYDKLYEVFKRAAGQVESIRYELPTEILSSLLGPGEEKVLRERAERLVGDELNLEFEDSVFRLATQELIGFISTDISEEFSTERITEYVKGLAEVVDRPAQNARFAYENGRVIEFAPHRDGAVISIDENVVKIESALVALVEGKEEEWVEIEVSKTSPAILTAEVNDLGIVERLGKGESYYKGSISPRVYNVGLTAKKLNGVIVPPGEEFSFNGSVGEISAATGFKTAYIIQNGRTVLGDGGGVCQDSTTLFRAVMDAGLPITERWAHSYRVGYYEQNSKPGFDATVFAPSKDFRFINDTPGHLLIQATAYEAQRKLVIEIYGKSDGRLSYVSEARIWDVTPPPPDLYQDDPSLPAGTVKQVDWSAWGSKTAFDYRVERDGEVIFSKTYSSNFRPWQNVFLRGTGD